MISKLCKCCFQVFEWSLEISTHFMRRRKKRCESLIVFPVDSACFYAIDFIERSWTVWRMTKNRTEKGIFLLLFFTRRSNLFVYSTWKKKALASECSVFSWNTLTPSNVDIEKVSKASYNRRTHYATVWHQYLTMAQIHIEQKHTHSHTNTLQRNSNLIWIEIEISIQ